MDFAQARAVNDAVRSLAMRHRATAAALLAPLGLHPGQEVILFELAAAGPQPQARLAAASGCEPPTITGSVRKLESAGLVVRRGSPTDGRVSIVELSDRGRELMPELERVWRELAELTTGDAGAATAGRLTDALASLAANLREPTGPRPPMG